MDHLNERTLEQLRTHTLSLLELEQAKRHIGSCPHCGARYQAVVALDQRLASLPLEEPTAEFTRQVLSLLDAPVKQDNIRRKPARPSWFRPELANALVATAATYAFLTSGVLQALFSINQGLWEQQLYARAQVVIDLVNQLSQVLH